MKLRSICILLVIMLALVPFFYFHRLLQKQVRPRESPARFFLFLFATFLLLVVYTILVVGLIVKIFPLR
jgi:hypothetical protein